jgi:hypothetical protein
MQERICEIKETLNKLIQLGVRQAFIPLRVHHLCPRGYERNQPLTVRLYTLKGTSALEGTEPVEGLNQGFLKSNLASYA